ncbi:rod shape-determining protein MreC [Paenibacillus sp. MWE-103]|uniref:Cell shape-determining protein MreC n=2 Tax=Paenibacillus artemisiicola TaxID=1172618 RepID=A0ABS3WB48_9BACL|nr:MULTISPECIES: rod shape-determining protein MreC [Paenibacillus]MBO7745483.1 rod shape-determining protein MreC [Paenibacillus artemisiicola]
MRNKRMFVLMIVFIIFVAVMGFSIGDRKKLTWPENFALDTSGFFQQWLYRPAGYVSDLVHDLTHLREVYKENEQLRIAAAAYARDSIKYNFMEAELKQLQDDLSFTENQKKLNNYKYLIAQVVAVNNDPYDETIRINLGSKDGIKPNMVVVTNKGLVGLTTRVDPFFSSVMPITKLNVNSTDTKQIAATVLGKENDSFGIVDNYDSETGKLSMSKISEHDPLKKGDTVITSGKGNVFPRGVVIGTVDSSQVGDFGLTYTATITPAADFDHLTEVFVVQTPDLGDETP